MKISAGTFLQSVSSPEDATFDDVIIFITEYNTSGATGFVINKKHGRYLNELSAFAHTTALPLYAGGPVKNDQLYFVHRSPQLIKDGIHITDDIYLGGNFEQALNHISNNSISTNDIKLFIGYCGWDAGQLEEEIKEGGWLIVNMETGAVFD